MSYTHNGMEDAKGITGIAGGPGPKGATGAARQVVLEVPEDGVEDAIVDACFHLANTLILKRRDYGRANIGKFGELGILVRLDDKVSRIHNINKYGSAIALNEPVKDSWLDAAGYSMIGYLYSQGKW